MESFDLIVLGSGSGLEVASAYASRGKDVAIVEPGRLGGTCLNRGCIPSKMLIHHADIVETVNDSERFHIDAEVDGIKFSQIMKDVNSKVEEDSKRIEDGLRQSSNHTLYKDEAHFESSKTLRVGDEKIIGDKIVVAAGSRPRIPSIKGIDDVDFLTSKDALRLNECPDQLIVIGGGYVSLELSYFYSMMGSEVTILEQSSTLLSREDVDVSEKITSIAEEKYNVFTNVSATRLTEENGKKTVYTKNNDDVGQRFVADEVLVATGRTPNTDKLYAEEAGLNVDKKGFLKTDEYMETNVEDVYALGDITGNYMFKHSANLEAEHVFKNSYAGKDYPIDYSIMPHAVFTSPQISSVGKKEQEINQEYITAKYNYSDTGMGMALKNEHGFVKVLAAPDGEILGCHILGPEASTLIHEVLVAMKSGNKNVKDIKDTVHIHPALNEVVSRAFNQM